MKEKKNKFINIKFALAILASLALFTYGLAWIVSIPNSVLGVFAIKNFDVSNDWIGFGGYILTAFITLVVFWGTINQTRDIQDRITKNEEDILLNNSRTSIEDIVIITSFNISKQYREMLKGNKLILTKEYTYMDSLLRHDAETYAAIINDIGKGDCLVANVNHLDSLIDSLNHHEKYIFRIIKNIGNNTMHGVKVTYNGNWFIAGEVINNDILTFNIKSIDSKECVVLPLFKINNNINLYQFTVSETIVEYYTGVFGLREKMKVVLKYNTDENSIYENIEIQKITEDCFVYKYDFMNYTYIQV